MRLLALITPLLISLPLGTAIATPPLPPTPQIGVADISVFRSSDCTGYKSIRYIKASRSDRGPCITLNKADQSASISVGLGKQIMLYTTKDCRLDKKLDWYLGVYWRPCKSLKGIWAIQVGEDYSYPGRRVVVNGTEVDGGLGEEELEESELGEGDSLNIEGRSGEVKLE